MTRLIQLIQRIAKNVLEADKPMEIQFGMVTEITPLKIKISQKVTLEGEMILRGAVPSIPLRKGDEVILLRNR